MTVIGVPTTGSIPVKVIGCIENVLLTRKDVIPFYVEGSLVYDSRNKILGYAREHNADLLFLDSDICFPIEGYDRLLAHTDADIVSGLYFGRHEGSMPIAYKKMRPKTIFRKQAIRDVIDEIPASRYMPIEAAGLGFCLVRSNVVKSFSNKENPFEPYGNVGEDFAFFDRCRKKGFKIMLDASFELKHLGQYAYTSRDCAGWTESKV